MSVRSPDFGTAEAFAKSWNNLPSGPTYSYEQVVDWFHPISKDDIEGKTVLELGCGNGSLMFHLLKWGPKKLHGVDLGDSVSSARDTLSKSGFLNWTIEQADLVGYQSSDYDFVYSIGVLHHLECPKKGFKAVIRNVKAGGQFHCWVYGRAGNGIVVYLVDPLRRLVSKFPWWVIKYCVATPLSILLFMYVRITVKPLLKKIFWRMPLYKYCTWLNKRGYKFVHHVVTDQLISPRTVYIRKEIIEQWFRSTSRIQMSTTYIIKRNGNSWKFGGKVV